MDESFRQVQEHLPRMVCDSDDAVWRIFFELQRSPDVNTLRTVSAPDRLDFGKDGDITDTVFTL